MSTTIVPRKSGLAMKSMLQRVMDRARELAGKGRGFLSRFRPLSWQT